ncbi:MAG: invasion associated locus B family protein [Alphaproteobacteria bacterium]|nr:invasion associated locus B family protein [Alphaproteobacteria bacterium]
MGIKKIIFPVLIAVMALIFSSNAYAAEPREVGVFGDWTAYVLTERGQKVCYMVSVPKKAQGKYTKRDEVFALITHRPSQNTKDVFSYITGYTYKPGSDASVTISGKKYPLFTQGDTAWTPDAESDAALATAIQKGSDMVVKGTSKRGTLTTDTFSLKGSGGAYQAITKECGY